MVDATTFEYLKPTEAQIRAMARVRLAFAVLAQEIKISVPEGPDKDYVVRKLRECGMWTNVCITRNPDGSPRD